MNTKYLFLLLFTLLLAGCKAGDGDAEDVFVVDKEFLKQTSWKGTATFRSEIRTEVQRIGLLFITDKRGNYELHPTDDDFDRDPDSEDFQYEVEGKLLTISRSVEGDMPYLRGDWMIVEKERNRLVLVRGINNDYLMTVTLVLTRNF